MIQRKEVWFAEFPYEEDNTKSKDRPVIVIDTDESGARVLAMKVTSTSPKSEYEIELFDWEKIPLHHKSTADVSNVRFILKKDFRRKIGQLSDDDWDNVMNLYAQYLANTSNDI